MPDIAGHRVSAARYVAVATRPLASTASRSNQQTSLVLTARNHPNVLFQTVSCFTLRYWSGRVHTLQRCLSVY